MVQDRMHRCFSRDSRSESAATAGCTYFSNGTFRMEAIYTNNWIMQDHNFHSQGLQKQRKDFLRKVAVQRRENLNHVMAYFRSETSRAYDSNAYPPSRVLSSFLSVATFFPQNTQQHTHRIFFDAYLLKYTPSQKEVCECLTKVVIQ